MRTKDGATIATSWINTVQELIDIIEQMPAALGKRRLVHLVTGDGIPTNENASKRVRFHYNSTFMLTNVRYLFGCWVCGPHCSNLVVETAIRDGQRGGQPEKSDPLCCNASRYFKYLTPHYDQDFGTYSGVNSLLCVHTRRGPRIAGCSNVGLVVNSCKLSAITGSLLLVTSIVK